jgi:hypothetical protein
MVERLTDEQVADLTGHWDWKMTNLAREVQQQRALIPEVIEQLERTHAWIASVEPTAEPIALAEVIAKLREAIE